MNTEITTVCYADMEKMAAAICKSGLFGMKTPEQALALMCVAQAEGRHPGSVATEYHIIQGRPALKADTMLARFQQAGGKVQWTEYSDARVAGIFSHPNGGSVEIGWTFSRAKAAGLTDKQTWKQYPRQMLRSRVVSEGVRTVYPGVAVGIYTPEEVADFEPTNTLHASGKTISVNPDTGEILGNPATEKQRNMIYTKLKNASINTAIFEDEFGKLENLQLADVNRALEWIEKFEVPEGAPY